LNLVVVQLEVEIAFGNVGAIDDYELETVQFVELAVVISNIDPVDAEGGAAIHGTPAVGHDRRAGASGIYVREKWSDDHSIRCVEIERSEFLQRVIERDVPVVIDK